MSTVETFFLITVNSDGTLTSYTEMPEEVFETARVANHHDIYQAAREIVQDFEQQMISNRVAQTVLQVLMPQAPPTPAEAVKDKLKERGINPEGIEPTE